MEQCRLELIDFSDKPLSLAPTQLSSRYRKVEPEELFQLLMDLLK
ncbi:lipoprotein [gut metagenome]|uniref:Lipoprotein n=1 Tax=gut metagenome TaxID=749906 RepID=J9FTZ5_9ZZZZ